MLTGLECETKTRDRNNYSKVVCLDQPSGIRFQTSSEMRLRTLIGSHWKHCFSDNISMLAALEVLTTTNYINEHFAALLTIDPQSLT